MSKKLFLPAIYNKIPREITIKILEAMFPYAKCLSRWKCAMSR